MVTMTAGDDENRRPVLVTYYAPLIGTLKGTRTIKRRIRYSDGTVTYDWITAKAYRQICEELSPLYGKGSIATLTKDEGED